MPLYLYLLVQIKATTTIYYICFCLLGFSESTNAVNIGLEAGNIGPGTLGPVLICQYASSSYSFQPQPQNGFYAVQ